MNSPKISIITVCFNAAASIEVTINSVINQTYDNIEYIIVDGASNDGTPSIIEKYSHRIPKWISEPDTGIYDAMNKGISMATGDWVYFLGSGDILLNMLDKLAPKLKDQNCIYYGNVYRNDLQTIYDGKFSGYKLAVTNICHQAIFYPSAVFKKYKFNTKYKTFADHDLNMRCYGNKDIDFKHVPMLISIYEGDGVSASTPDVEFFKDKLAIIRENFSGIVFLYAYLRRSIASIIRNNH